MNKKVKSIPFGKIAVIFVMILFLITAIILVIRPDYRFEAKQVIKSMGGASRLEEINSDSIEKISVNVNNAAGCGCTINHSKMLINTDHILPDGFKPQIREYKSTGVKMNNCMIAAYSKLSSDIKEQTGENLYVMSSFRTAEEQKEIEEEQGSDTAMTTGSSEHQTGLGLDVYFDGYAGQAIIKCDAGQYLNEYCWKNGFIIRYPVGKKKITGIDYEPWHIRYVGAPHAEIIMKNHLTLEEYYETLEPGKFYRYKEYIISRQSGENLQVPKGIATEISSDNCGNYIITVKIPE